MPLMDAFTHLSSCPGPDMQRPTSAFRGIAICPPSSGSTESLTSTCAYMNDLNIRKVNRTRAAAPVLLVFRLLIVLHLIELFFGRTIWIRVMIVLDSHLLISYLSPLFDNLCRRIAV